MSCRINIVVIINDNPDTVDLKKWGLFGAKIWTLSYLWADLRGGMPNCMMALTENPSFWQLDKFQDEWTLAVTIHELSGRLVRCGVASE